MNILTLSTYPIDNPLHGGQHRLFNIVQAYRDAGHTVQAAGVLGSDQYPTSSGFVPYPGTAPLTKYIANPFLMDDWAIGELFSSDAHYFKSLVDAITMVPDLIHVEQPWLFKFATRFAKQYPNKKIKLIYGSQNIEHDMKFDIVKTYMGVDAAHAAQDKVLRCETAAIALADGICCVSQNDLDWTKLKTKMPCVLGYNGVKNRKTTDEGVVEANAITGHKKFAVYCASAHPPNINGFFEMFGGGVGCIAPDELIVIAGGAGSHILSDARFAKTAGLSKACITAGTVSESCLQGLLDTAHTNILPITHGGGTNLKTAEALWSGKHIVATTIALRGFESFSKSKGVAVADKPSKFLAALRFAMSQPPNILSVEEHAQRKSVLWSEALKPLLTLASTK
jgi:Glycosyl transferases group 1